MKATVLLDKSEYIITHYSDHLYATQNSLKLKQKWGGEMVPVYINCSKHTVKYSTRGWQNKLWLTL